MELTPPPVTSSGTLGGSYDISDILGPSVVVDTSIDRCLILTFCVITWIQGSYTDV